MISNSFKKVNHINGTEKIDDTLLHIYSPNGLIQAMGYLKYQLGMKNYGLVFRGQADLYEKELKPSLYRGIKTQQSATFKQEELNKTITHAQKDVTEIFKGVKPSFVTPLLQHYGLKTEWLDVVDNIWIALWFACYETLSIKNVPFMILKQRSEKCEKIKMIEHLKKIVTTLSNKKTELQNIKNEQLSVAKTDCESLQHKQKTANLSRKVSYLKKRIKQLEEEEGKLNKKINEKSYAYILMIRCPGNISGRYGVWKDEEAELYDLRYCLPSTFLRPHAQHGLVIRRITKKGKSTACYDYSKLLEGVLRIDLDDALSWLGNSILLSPEALFPSPVNDHGLQQLLKSETLRQHLQISTP